MKTILLVDDDSFIRQLLAKFFQKMVFFHQGVFVLGQKKRGPVKKKCGGFSNFFFFFGEGGGGGKGGELGGGRSF